MKRYIFLFCFLFLSFSNAKVNAIVSILPQQLFLEELAGDLVHTALMVQVGSSPHTYEPKPSQMIEVSNAQVYFSIGVEFEKVWLEKFRNQNKNLLIVDVSKGIERIEIKKHSHEAQEHQEHDDGHKHEGKDPHVWVSPENVKIIAKNMLDALMQLDSTNTATYEKNYALFMNKIEQTDKKIKSLLKDVPSKTKFMVFHPSWGYFAKQYDLEQFAIEVEGKEPKPKELAMILEEAKEENVKAIFTQPEFSDKSAKIIAKELNIQVIKASPLSKDWEQTLINIAKAIANR